MSAVPELDISPFLNGDASQRMQVARRLDEVCRDVGFFCLTGHGVSEAQFSGIYDVSKAFFHLGLNQKRQVSQPAPDIVRGYIGVGEAALGGTMGEDTPPDWKESFSAGPVDVVPEDPYFKGPLVRGHYAPNHWPSEPQSFGQIWTDYYREMSRLSSDIMRLSALALGLEEHFFADKIDRHIGILGAMYYPDQETPPDKVIGGQLCIDLLQLRIVVRPKEGERCGQGTRAHTCDD